jgi:hypothetical protein
MSEDALPLLENDEMDPWITSGGEISQEIRRHPRYIYLMDANDVQTTK